VVASLLLVLTLAADYFEWPQRRTSLLLYSVIIATYLKVIAVGVLLRKDTAPQFLSVVYLTGAGTFALMFVQGTGGVSSPFSFLYLWAIIDASIIGGQRTAVGLASACSVVYGLQLVLQLYEILPAGDAPLPGVSEFAYAVGVHMGAFYLVGFLSGHLAELLKRARELASTAQFDLEHFRHFHAALIESLPLGVLTINDAMVVRTANQAASGILARSMNQLVGEKLPGPLVDFATSGDSYREAALQLDARNVYFAMSCSPVNPRDFDATEDLESLSLVVIEDRTEVRALEENLQAKERLASIGELAAAIAHELRNPLASMSGSIELLGSSSTAGEEAQARLRAIVLREVAQLNRLVEDFLVFAKPAKPECIDFDICTLCREVVDSIGRDPSWADYRIELSLPGVVRVSADPMQLRRVLWNLVRNALEASSPDAKVEVGIEVGMSVEGIMIFVRDEGDGIAPEIRGAIFEPFRTTKQGGTGLGLSISHRIVESHDGRFEVESVVGRGTTMRVFLKNQGG
jgi:two-component system sensor histidine kinase PilS (NtrC family)